MARLNECILYRDFEHGDLLAKMAEIMTLWEKDAADLKSKEGQFFRMCQWFGGNGRFIWIFRKPVALLSDLPAG